MSDGHKLVHLMREIGKVPQNEIVDLVYGKVTSIDPLKIKIENLELPETFFTLSPMCVDKRSPSGDLLWYGIRKGNSVAMIRLSRGQKYYVLHPV